MLALLLAAAGGANAKGTPTTATLRAKIVPIPVNPGAATGPTYADTGNILGSRRRGRRLGDVYGLSGADTAQHLGVSRAAMKSRLHRARERFHDELDSQAA